MLPDNDGVLVEVGDVGAANTLWILFHKHPTEVRVQETLADGVWVFFGIRVSVMGSVISRPPSYRAFDGTSTSGGKEDAEW